MFAAELRIHHSRQPSATRRVAPEPLRAPRLGGSEPAQLLAAVCVAWNAPLLDEEDRERLDTFMVDVETRRPPRGLRHRIQTDTHGLDVSLHLSTPTARGWRVRLDDHGPSAPQVVGALVALGGLGEKERRRGIEFVRDALSFPGGTFDELHACVHDMVITDTSAELSGIEAWALEILGLEAAKSQPMRERDVVRAFRRALRGVHPDHGAPHDGAADRLDDIQRARRILIGVEDAVS